MSHELLWATKEAERIHFNLGSEVLEISYRVVFGLSGDAWAQWRCVWGNISASPASAE